MTPDMMRTKIAELSAYCNELHRLIAQALKNDDWETAHHYQKDKNDAEAAIVALRKALADE